MMPTKESPEFREWRQQGRYWVRLSDGFKLPIIQGGGKAVVVQRSAWAFGTDNGSESGHSLDTVNVPRTAQVADVSFLIRIGIGETAGGSDNSSFALFAQKNGTGGYTEVTTARTDGIIIANDTQSRSDDESTTQRLASGSGTWTAGKYDDGQTQQGTTSISQSSQFTEVEFCIQIDSTYAADSDYWDLRVEKADGTDLATYNGTMPRVTASIETLTQVNKDIQALWDIDVLVNKDVQAKWDIDVLVNKDTQLVWDLFSLVNKDIQVDYDILNLVNKDIQAVWDMSGSVNKDIQAVYDILNLIEKDTQAVWDIRNLVNKDIQAQWDITQLVNKDIQAVWDMSGVVNKDIQAVWDLLNLVNKDIEGQYDIFNLVSKDIEAIWDMRQLANKDIQAVWDMSGIINKDIAVQYDIDVLVNKDIQLLWDILNLVSKDIQLDWDILNLANKDIQAVWDILQGAGIVSKDIEVIYDILSIVSAQKRQKTAFPFWF